MNRQRRRLTHRQLLKNKLRRHDSGVCIELRARSTDLSVNI